jgi:hypothetical protein
MHDNLCPQAWNVLTLQLSGKRISEVEAQPEIAANPHSTVDLSHWCQVLHSSLAGTGKQERRADLMALGEKPRLPWILKEE